MRGERMKEKNVVMIVDDQEEQANTLKLILEREGYIVEVAYNGKKALEHAENFPFDAAILDINLPDIDGTGLIEKLRACNKEIVIIMLTGFPSQHNTMEAINRGAHGYLVKPASKERLLSMLADRLYAQKEKRNITQEKMGEFIAQRLEKLRKM